MKFRLALLALAALAFARPGHATYSITAVDRATRQVGGTGTSCISGGSVYRIYGSAPGFGAVNSQALASTQGRDEAVRLLAQGWAPDAIIQRLTDPAFDLFFESRQYGIVALSGQSAGHSGTATQSYSNDLQGNVEPFAFSIQGNILTGEAVLSQARAAFVDGRGCDLAARLMLALEGGAKNAQGDRRCTPSGIPADAAYIQVDLPGQPRGSFLYLEVSATAPQSPVVRLRQLYDSWRVNHACPTGGSAGSSGAGGGGTGATPGACSIGLRESSMDYAAWIALGLGVLAALRTTRRARAARG
ncbi:MAG TPA: DUF1028 domain-containing protein [Polyangiaceae bacterium]|nr:DUF1028 domain-containing protein [Polyangiaceae bacterium]